MTIRALIMTAEGQSTETSIPSEDTGMNIARMIGCDLFDVVGLDHDIDLFVDDEGIINSRPLNLPATVLAHVLGSRSVLFGTAIAVSTDQEGSTISLTDVQIEAIREALKRRPDPATIDQLAESLAPFPGIVAMLRS